MGDSVVCVDTSSYRSPEDIAAAGCEINVTTTDCSRQRLGGGFDLNAKDMGDQVVTGLKQSRMLQRSCLNEGRNTKTNNRTGDRQNHRDRAPLTPPHAGVTYTHSLTHTSTQTHTYVP